MVLSPARRLSPVLLALAVLSPGCYYVTQADREEKELSVDQDNDGAPFAGPGKDCDDLDPDRSPAFAEIAYDGIDNDCLNDGDLLDVDGDGFAGVLFADWVPAAGVEWPAALPTDQLDCVDDDAMLPAGDDASLIFPGTNSNEVDYDGVDSDCAADNDFDADGDGFMLSRDQQAFEDYVAQWGYEDRFDNWFPEARVPSYGDCDDLDAAAYPGAAGDVFFDGIDTNCDGVNDFDGDGDGFMPPTYTDPTDGSVAETQPAFDAFEAKYDLSIALPSDVTGRYGVPLTAFSDCVDVDDDRFITFPLPLLPEEIYPRPYVPGSTDDEPYDGVDEDCQGDNDFDGDDDGYVKIGTDTEYSEYIAAWEYESLASSWVAENFASIQPLSGDCDDRKPDTNPGALEVIGDAVDQDCDGDEASSAFAFNGYSADPVILWTNPSSPKFRRIDNAYILGVTSEGAYQGSSQPDAAASVVKRVGPLPMAFVSSSAGSQGVMESALYSSLADGNGRFDMVVDDRCLLNGDVQALFSYAVSEPAARLTTAPIGWTGTTISAGGGQYFFLAGLDWGNRLDLTSTISYGVNCEGRVAIVTDNDQIFVALGSEPSPQQFYLGFANAKTLFHAPYLADYDPNRWMVTACDDQGLCSDLEFGFDLGTYGAIGNDFSSERWAYGATRTHNDGASTTVLVDFDDPRRVVLRGSNLTEDVSLTAVGDVLSVDGIALDDKYYLVLLEASESGPPTIRLIFNDVGAPATSATVVPLNFESPITAPNAVPVEVTMHADDDRIAVAVVAHDPLVPVQADAVGWLFLGPPQ
jgi:hypothetical protein